MPEAQATGAVAPPAGAVALCASAALADGGAAHLFDVLLWRAPARAFALRFEGRVVCYVNRCAHVPVEMDWQPGEFLDADRRFIVCSMHGALYEPASGRCVGGPCVGEHLLALDVSEQSGWVYWYPSRDIAPAAARASAPPPNP